MKQSQLFNTLNSVDSTNNYAMAKVHEGMATHGMAWFAHSQTAGKGQRGKEWQSESGQNILLSIVVKPDLIFRAKPFYFSAFVALCCQEFLSSITGDSLFIKWPNDLYWRDRKAGGILIENSFAGTEWKWSVVGVGINVNQSIFKEGGSRAVSLHEICGREHDPVLLAQQLHEYILEKYGCITSETMPMLLPQYNKLLYKKNEEVKLKKNFAVFFTTIKEVNETGQLVTFDTMERVFNFGGVQWML
jgi:BirA family transcriptional regulator, biotin operon repressor / biotin---[acetyl-CoA-carboxylase] ligase